MRILNKNIMPYTLKELSYLKDIENHKIIYDGYDFVWYSNRGNDFELHSIKCFKDYKELLSYIFYWTNKYKKEYNKKDTYLDSMLKESNLKLDFLPCLYTLFATIPIYE